jgi:hypothetical protein
VCFKILSLQTSRTGGSSAFSPSSSTLSDSLSETAKRDEFCEEVENLVRSVLPEETDYIDEVMLQFKDYSVELNEIQYDTMQGRLSVTGTSSSRSD